MSGHWAAEAMYQFWLYIEEISGRSLEELAKSRVRFGVVLIGSFNVRAVAILDRSTVLSRLASSASHLEVAFLCSASSMLRYLHEPIQLHTTESSLWKSVGTVKESSTWTSMLPSILPVLLMAQYQKPITDRTPSGAKF